ncbi:MAG: hypothetical protein HYY67_04875 [Thaumarchaeota archaeon]|nr:hypothetical protein [Nitrososphaerota archaeon]
MPSKDAFEWCTDYRENDFSIMGMKGKRQIRKVSNDVIILTDIIYNNGKSITKKKLVRLDARKLFWSNTHLAGPNKHSQFLYQIIPIGKKSKLEFTGPQVNYSKTEVSQKEIKLIQKEAEEEDSAIWKRLAKKIEGDLN